MQSSKSRKRGVAQTVPAKRPPTLTGRGLATGVRVLSGRDVDLCRIVEKCGPPPMWERTPGFPTLVHIILEQQVSLASARAAYLKLLRRVTRLTPLRFLDLDATTLKRCGFSRQKTDYCRQLARSIVDRRLVVGRLAALDDGVVRSELTRIKGIGSWSADIYLLMALRRPDVWPTGDLALASSVRRIKRLKSIPTPGELERIGLAWRPWRAVAARILWHDYLNGTNAR